jgi:hypothetical protein
LGIEKDVELKDFLIFGEYWGLTTDNKTRNNLLILALEVINIPGHEGHKFIKKVQALH